MLLKNNINKLLANKILNCKNIVSVLNVLLDENSVMDRKNLLYSLDFENTKLVA